MAGAMAEYSFNKPGCSSFKKKKLRREGTYLAEVYNSLSSKKDV